MKKQLSILIGIFCCTLWAIAQSPNGITYQGIALNDEGNPLANSEIGIQIAVVNEAADGSEIYKEQHNLNTTETGIFNLTIGRGNALFGTFAEIDWEAKRHFLSIELSESGNAPYRKIGTVELLSVPYALYATKTRDGKKGEKGIKGPTGEKGEIGDPGPKGLTGPIGPYAGKGATGARGKKGPQTLTMLGTPPDNAVEGTIYLDDGSNRQDGKVGLRYFTGTEWLDF